MFLLTGVSYLPKRPLRHQTTGMGVGKEAWESWHPWILKIFAKKGWFLSFEWEKTILTTFGLP